MKGQRNQANARKHETHETLAGESMQSVEHEIVAIKRSAGAHPRQNPVWARPTKKTYIPLDERPQRRGQTWRPTREL